MARAGKKPRARRIAGGVDTHQDTHHAAVELMNGSRVADAEFPATARGYEQLLAWMRSSGRLHAVGVEGTGSYGAGLARYLASQDVKVIEVSRPDRRQRRAKGKSDPLDAYAAADAVLAGRAAALPKGGDGIAEPVRVVHLARAGAVKARTAAINELRALLVTAPAVLREQLAGLGTAKLRAACARLRPGADAGDPVTGTKLALRSLARRWQALDAEVKDHDTHLTALITRARPDLLDIRGVGPGNRRPAPDHLRRQPAPAAHTGRLRRFVRGLPGPRIVGEDPPAPAVPRRRPPGQPRPVLHRPQPPGHLPAHPRLRSPPRQRGPVRQGNPPVPQTLHRPRTLQGPDQARHPGQSNAAGRLTNHRSTRCRR